MTTPAIAAGATPAPKNLVARFIGALTAPRETFASIAAHPKWFGMLAKVSRGAVRAPMKRATRFFGAGVAPAAIAGVVMQFCLKVENRSVQSVRERPIVPCTYTTPVTKMFPDAASEPSRPLTLTEKF